METEFCKLLPHIDVLAGKSRVMDNMKLYMTLLGKFKGREMTDNLINAINNKDKALIMQHAHALRGTASNLSFLTMQSVTSEVEQAAKNDEDCTKFIDDINFAYEDLNNAIEELQDMV